MSFAFDEVPSSFDTTEQPTRSQRRRKTSHGTNVEIPVFADMDGDVKVGTLEAPDTDENVEEGEDMGEAEPNGPAKPAGPLTPVPANPDNGDSG